MRDRDVLLAAVLVVAFVLAVAWLTGLVPAFDNAIGLTPVVTAALVVVTVFVLFRALFPRRSRPDLVPSGAEVEPPFLAAQQPSDVVVVSDPDDSRPDYAK